MSDPSESPDADFEPARPELPTHDEKTCPECGGDHTLLEVVSPSIFSDDYLDGVDQRERYYACTECSEEWRYVESEDR